jgi:hypothetical protein
MKNCVLGNILKLGRCTQYVTENRNTEKTKILNSFGVFCEYFMKSPISIKTAEFSKTKLGNFFAFVMEIAD